MKKTLVPYLVLMLIKGFVYAQTSDSEDDESFYSSDDASYESVFEESFSQYGSVMLCLPSHYFPRAGVLTPHFIDEYEESIDEDGVLYEQRFQRQELPNEVGPVNPLTTHFHIQGVHEDPLRAPIIFFTPARAFQGQLDAVDNGRMAVVGPVYLGREAYAVVPDDGVYTAETTEFRGTFIRYNPGETTAREALNAWLLEHEGWYVEVGGQPDELQIIDEGGEVLTHHDAGELNAFWADEYGLRLEPHEESIFAEIEVLVQRIFWRFYNAACPETNAETLWFELLEKLEGLIEEDEWSELVRVYLRNYQGLLTVWYDAFREGRLLQPIYITPPHRQLVVAEAIAAIQTLIGEVAVDRVMWPTGLVTRVEHPIPVGEPILIGEPAPVFDEQALNTLLWQVANFPVDTLCGARECWF